MKKIQRPRTHSLFLLAVCLFFIASCATGNKAMIAAHDAKKDVVTKTYQTSSDVAFLAVSTVFKKWSNASHYKENREGLFVTGLVGSEPASSKYTKIFFLGAIASATMVTHGAFAGAWVIPAEGGVNVDVVMDEGVGVQSLVSKQDLQDQIATAISIISSGQQLPEKAPESTATK